MSICKDRVFHISDINEELVLIDNSEVDYVTRTGNVYKYLGDDLYLLRKTYQNKYNKYMYTTYTNKDGKSCSKRSHILLAIAFIPNPDPIHLTIVGHKDDVKWNNDLDNLYWTDTQENTQSAINRGLNVYKSGADNNASQYIKVLDKTTKQIVGIYGSISECAKCIDNITKSSVAKLCRDTIYTPRGKNFIYLIATKDEYEQNQSLQQMHLVENIVIKNPKRFRMCNVKIGYDNILDNQTEASKITNIPQAIISKCVRENSCYGDWEFELIEEINYKDASAYNNLVETLESVTIQNIYTKEIITYNTKQELKNALNINGHDIKQYLDKEHILMEEWKILSFDNKHKS